MTDQELTIALAERVMGWTQRGGGDFGTPAGMRWNWSPLTDWNDAMELAEKWREQDPRRFLILDWGEKEWQVDAWQGSSNGVKTILGMGYHPSGPRAVCYAISESVGIEV